jgi:hypothetical protein
MSCMEWYRAIELGLNSRFGPCAESHHFVRFETEGRHKIQHTLQVSQKPSRDPIIAVSTSRTSSTFTLVPLEQS